MIIEGRDGRTIAKKFVSNVLKQPKPLETLTYIFEDIPEGLLRQFSWALKSYSRTTSSSGIEIEMVEVIDTKLRAAPGDIIIRQQNRYPNINDIVEICTIHPITYEHGIAIMQVLKINSLTGIITACDLFKPSIMIDVMNVNIACVCKVLKFGSPDWLMMVSLFDIKFNPVLFIRNTEMILQHAKLMEEDVYIRNNDNKEDIIKLLEDRLTLLTSTRVNDNSTNKSWEQYIQ